MDQLWENTSTSTATDEFQYGYDLLGNRLYRDNTVNTAFGELYSYDDLNQLASFQRGTLNTGKTAITGTVARSQSFATDAVGNFTGVTTNGTTQTRSANDQNEITAISGATTPTYDANGNMTGDETGRQFVYDAWNRLVVVKDSGGSTLETFGYDGLNRRVSVDDGTTVTDLYYSKDWQTLEEKVGSNYSKRYVWSPVYVDAMVLRDRDTNADGTLDERLWVQQDANWNVTALLDGGGVVVERYAYDPYGVQTVYNASWSSIGSSAYGFRQGFQGMAFDATSGLDLSRGRPGYSPTLGMWVGPDPIRFGGGDVRLYGFVGNNPVNALDSSGLCEDTDPTQPIQYIQPPPPQGNPGFYSGIPYPGDFIIPSAPPFNFFTAPPPGGGGVPFQLYTPPGPLLPPGTFLVNPYGGPRPNGSYGTMLVPGPSGLTQSPFGTPGFSTTFDPFHGYYFQPSFQTTTIPFSPTPPTGAFNLNANIPLYSNDFGAHLNATGSLHYPIYPSQGPLTGSVGVEGAIPLLEGPLGGQVIGTFGAHYPVYPTPGPFQYNGGFQYQLPLGGPPRTPGRWQILPGWFRRGR